MNRLSKKEQIIVLPQVFAAFFLEEFGYADVRWIRSRQGRVPISIFPTKLMCVNGDRDCFYWLEDGTVVAYDDGPTSSNMIRNQVAAFLLSSEQPSLTKRLLNEIMYVIETMCFVSRGGLARRRSVPDQKDVEEGNR